MVFETTTADGSLPTSFAYQINKCSSGYRDVTSAGIVNVVFSGTASDHTTSDIASQIWSKGEVETYSFNYGIILVPDE